MAFAKFDVLFNNLKKSINKQKVDEILDTYSADHTNVERFVLAYKNLQNFTILPFENGSQKSGLVDKSAKKSEEWRLMGNKTFSTCKDQLDEALVQYTRSVACAPQPASDGQSSGEELALAYGNRSLVLLTMSKPEASLGDIQQALDCGYPHNLRHKLYVRQAKCYQQMGKVEEANKSLEKALELLAHAPLASKAMESAKSEIELLQRKAVSPETKLAEAKLITLPAVSYKPHTTIPSASSCVDVRFSPELGRYIEANRDIKPGDVLMVEAPYASVLLPAFYFMHCYECFQRSSCLIPCRCCSQVMYCSSACRDISWTNVHRHECPMLPKLLDLDMGQDWLLALRTLLVTSHRCGGLREAVQTVNVVHPGAGVAARNLKHAPVAACDSVYSLVQHRDDRTFTQAYRLATVAACLVNALDEMTSLLADADEQLMGEVGGLLLHGLQSLPSNCYSVAGLVLTGGTALATESFGVAVYPTAGLVNHSCDANTVRSYHAGARLSVIASRPIAAGEQIFCDYGFSYNQYSLEERQKHLQSNYFFTCKCEACMEDWPQDDILSTVEPVFLCSQCSSPLLNADDSVALTECDCCRHKQSLAGPKKELQDVLETYVKIKVLLLSGFRQDFSQELATLLVVLDRIVERPNKAIIDVTDALRHNAMQVGNFYTV